MEQKDDLKASEWAVKEGGYKQIFDGAPIGYVIYEEDGRIITANRAFGRMVGAGENSTESESKNFFDYILPEYEDVMWEMIHRILCYGETDAVDVELQGECRTIAVTVTSRKYQERAEDNWKKRGGKAVIWSALTDTSGLKRKQMEIMELSRRDALTGMYNRHFYDDFVQNQNGDSELPLTVAMIDIDGLKMINDSLGHSFGDRAIIKVSRVLKKFASPNYLIIRTGGDEIVIFFRKTLLEEAQIYLNKVQEEIKSCILGGLPVSFSWGYAVKKEPEESLVTIISAAEDMMYSRKLLHSTGKKYETIDLILKTLFDRNSKIYRHSQRVSRLAGAFGQYLGWEQEKIHFLRQLGYVHDIGMASISDEILNKKELLNEEEKKEIRRHSETGYRILRSMPETHEMARVLLFHHENWDGSGYPYGIQGQEIPLESRLLMLVDAYDRMKYGYYGKAAENDKAIISELERWSGRQFDPWLERQFVKWMEEPSKDTKDYLPLF